MKQDEASAKKKILHAAIELISEGKNERQITMRQIALRAGVNLALVNYYFQTKDNLLSQAVGIMMDDIIEKTAKDGYTDADAQKSLRDMLLTTADAAFKHRNISAIAISAELKSNCENSCKLVKPLLKDILPECSESDLRIIALQLMIPFHHIVLNPEYYGRYLDTDFYDDNKRQQKINQMVDCVLAGRGK
jgi:AcrR family transcriptional regulator